MLVMKIFIKQVLFTAIFAFSFVDYSHSVSYKTEFSDEPHFFESLSTMTATRPALEVDKVEQKDILSNLVGASSDLDLSDFTKPSISLLDEAVKTGDIKALIVNKSLEAKMAVIE